MKWFEAEVYAQIKVEDLMKFVWKNIVCWFGIPKAIISDNSPQFSSDAFQQFCAKNSIGNSFASPKYPQSNGQAEISNKTLLMYLKKRLGSSKNG